MHQPQLRGIRPENVAAAQQQYAENTPLTRWFSTILLAIGCILASARQSPADVTISAAVSLKSALEKAQPELEKAAGQSVAFTFGASGTLAGQIRQGAPVDLFISADRANVGKLVEGNFAEKSSITVIAGNALVLIVPRPGPAAPPAPQPKSFADLSAVHRLAIGEPKVVPAGAYAKQVLTHLNLWDSLDKSGKLITGENVAAVLAYVERGEVDAGIVYATDAQAAKSSKVIATADPAWHDPIEYVSVLISASKTRESAAKVQRALTGEPVQSILRTYGFASPSRPTTQGRK